jgi:hypothetical protein
MVDLLQSAKLFEVSVRLQTASSHLARVAEGINLPSQDRATLRWAGNFLAEVDWNSGIKPGVGADGGLAVSATNTRPKFYASLMRIGPRFQDVGIDSEDKIYAFLKNLYIVLISGGTKKKGLRKDVLNLGTELLHILSRSIMVDLCNNGLPRQQPLLRI